MQNYLLNICISIKNAQIVRLNFIIIQPRTKICENLLKILWKEGYILGYQIFGINYDKFKVFLKYKNNKPIINNIKKISNSGNNIFYFAKNILKITDNNLLIIVFTSKGIKPIMKSKKFKIGEKPFILIN